MMRSMTNRLPTLVILALAAASLPRPADAQHPTMPPGMTHEEHLAQMKKDAEMKKRGAAAMGFDQDRTTHHFLLAADGGTIQVTVNDAKDAQNRDAIRAHLKTIAGDFAKGDFSAPLATHAETPPGVETMKRLASRITYTFDAMDQGGRVRIQTGDPEALKAVHDFLRYQIKEHRTGDPTTAKK